MATNYITSSDNFLTKLDQCRQEIDQLFTELSTKLSVRRQALLEELEGIEKRYIDSKKAEQNWKQLTEALNAQRAGLAEMEKVANLMGTEAAQINIENMKLAIKDMEQNCRNWRVKMEPLTNISFQADSTLLSNSINQLGAITVTPDYTNKTTPTVLYDAAGIGERELCYPWGIVLDNNDNIYIADIQNNKIIVVSIAGQFIREFGQRYHNGPLNGPRYICISNTNIYVSKTHSIVKFSIAGEFIGKIGTEGTGSNNNQFKYPCGIAYHNALIYVCDRDNNRIQVLTEELIYNKTIKHAKIQSPSAIAIRRDSIYVSAATSLHILSVAGEYISTLPHTFSYAFHITLDRYNNIIISGDGKITVISLSDNTIIHTISCNSTRGICITSNNNIVNVCGSMYLVSVSSMFSSTLPIPKILFRGYSKLQLY